MVFSDIILSSPITVAQTVFRKDIVLSLIYFVFAFFLNWLFGFAQILLIDDQNITKTSIDISKIINDVKNHVNDKIAIVINKEEFLIFNRLKKC